MRFFPDNRYFDVSTLLALSVAAFLLVSLPGGCWSDESDDEDTAEDVEAVTEPTAPPTMEIVEPEPGDIDTGEPPEDDGESGDEEEESAEEPDGDSEEEESEPAAEDGTYVVQEGDTVYAIATQFDVTMEDLMAANGIEDANALQVGQELTIP